MGSEHVQTEAPDVSPEEWAIVEIMGHLRRAGRISEVDRFGTKLLRVDVPLAEGEGFATEFFSGGAIYRLLPATEEVARAVAKQLGDLRPVAPVSYRLPPPREDDDGDEGDDDDRPF